MTDERPSSFQTQSLALGVQSGRSVLWVRLVPHFRLILPVQSALLVLLVQPRCYLRRLVLLAQSGLWLRHYRQHLLVQLVLLLLLVLVVLLVLLQYWLHPFHLWLLWDLYYLVVLLLYLLDLWVLYYLEALHHLILLFDLWSHLLRWYLLGLVHQHLFRLFHLCHQ